MQKIEEISFVRVLLMLMIYFHHVNVSYGGGICAVATFFILSGFVMTIGCSSKVLEENFSWRKFVMKRMARIYPTHWMGLLLSLVIVIPIYAGIKYVYAFGINALLLQSWFPKEWIYFSYNSPSWFLCNILFCTALFPFLVKIFYRFRPLSRYLLVAFVVLLSIGISVFFPHNLRHAWLYINPIFRLGDFIVGMGLAWIYEYLKKSNHILQFVSRHLILLDTVIVLILGLFVAQSITRFGEPSLYSISYWPLSCLLILGVSFRGLIPVHSFMRQIMNNRVVHVLGASSFAFYVFHDLLLTIGRNILDYCEFMPNIYIRGCFILVFVLGFSIAYTHYIENKLTTFLYSKL